MTWTKDAIKIKDRKANEKKYSKSLLKKKENHKKDMIALPKMEDMRNRVLLSERWNKTRK